MRSQIEKSRSQAGLTKAELARLAGVSASTVGRVEAGKMIPTVEMFDKLLAAAGARQPVTVEQLSDPAAISAVRALLDPATDLAKNVRVSTWLDRFRLLGWAAGDEPTIAARELAERAAQFARLVRRPGIRFFARDERRWVEYADALNRSGVKWAATGVQAANRLGVTGDTVWPVFYVSELESASDYLQLNEFRAPGLQVSLIPFDGMSEVGSYEDDLGLWWAAPLQVLMDCYSGNGRMPDVADSLAELWDRQALTIVSR